MENALLHRHVSMVARKGQTHSCFDISGIIQANMPIYLLQHRRGVCVDGVLFSRLQYSSSELDATKSDTLSL